MPCGTAGSFENEIKFQCEAGKALFVPFNACRPVDFFTGIILKCSSNI